MAKILLVEDEPDIAELVIAWLKNDHHVVDFVANGEDALSSLTVYQYDAIILDWMLPGVSGVEVCRKFRNRGGTTPILMLTAKRHVDEKEAGLDAGADDYLTK